MYFLWPTARACRVRLAVSPQSLYFSSDLLDGVIDATDGKLMAPTLIAGFLVDEPIRPTHAPIQNDNLIPERGLMDVVSVSYCQPGETFQKKLFRACIVV